MYCDVYCDQMFMDTNYRSVSKNIHTLFKMLCIMMFRIYIYNIVMILLLLYVYYDYYVA